MWEIKPDLVIETGIARGGSLIFISSMLELLSICGSEKKPRLLELTLIFENIMKSKLNTLYQKNPLIERI